MDGPIANEGRAPEPVRLTVEELLDEAAWVRSLAKRLVGGRAADADDVEQDTWVAALEHAPKDPAHRRSWLARVATNFAKLRTRGDAHRSQREMHASRPEGQPSASETLERLEAQRALVDALRALDEPYRTTVMRRYFDNMSAADIARAENTPAATVRWRLMHGLEALRARLDEKYGDRATWSLAFVPLIKPHVALTTAAAASGGAALTGVLVMNALTRTALVAALVVSGSLGVWLVSRPSQPLDTQTLTPAGTPTELDAPTVESKPKQDLAADDEKSPARVAAPTPSASIPSAPAANLTAHVDGRFVDETGKPIGGVRIVDPPSPDEHVTKSDEHGAFQLDIPLAPHSGSMPFEARCVGWATCFSNIEPRAGATQHMGDIVLVAGGSVAGVVLSPDGAPFAGAQVLATKPEFQDTDVDSQRRYGPEWGHVPRVPSAVSTGDGSFRIDGVPAKLARVWAHADGTRWAISDPLLVPAGGVIPGVVLKLVPFAADDRIDGVVLDPRDKPVAGVNVLYSCQAASGGWSSSIRSGDDGRFHIVVVRKVEHEFEVYDPQSRWPGIKQSGVSPGATELVLRFHEPKLVDLVVTDASGNAIDRFNVQTLGTDGRSSTWGPKAVEGDHTSIPIPDTAFLVEVWAAGRERKRIGPFDPVALPGPFRCALGSLPGLRGRVLSSGQPVRGAMLTLHRLARPRDHMEIGGWLTRINPNIDEDMGISDDHGNFEITVRRAGTYALVCEADGYARTENWPLEIDPGRGKDGVQVVLGRGGAIEGHVLVPDGRDAGGVIVGINCFDGHARTLRTGWDGTFRFEGLTPGAWQVKRAAQLLDPSTGGSSYGTAAEDIVYVGDCTVEDGRTTRFDLDLRKSFDVVLTGHVSVNGAPAAGWSVLVFPGESVGTSAPVPGGTVDENGLVRIALALPGKVRVQLQPATHQDASIELMQVLDLRPGDNPWVVDLTTGSIDVSVADGMAVMATYESLDADPLACSIRFTANSSQVFHLPLVPSGKGRITVHPVNGREKVQHDVQVDRGATTRVDLP